MIMWRKMLVRILFCLVGCMAACDTAQGAETLEGNGGATASAIPAFPGAEGFGARATGGRGGKVYLVETLDDYNPNEGEKPIPGSLRAAIEAEGPRTLVFRVSGMIDLKRNLNLDNDHIPIAGQTAPGDGICLKSRPMYITASYVIPRYLRFRPGDEAGEAFDCVNGKRLSNLIMDHCSKV